MQGAEYWGDIWELIKKYKDHPESKFDGDTGWLERKHLVIDRSERIGKEVLDLEIQFLQLTTPKIYLTERQRREHILGMDKQQAKLRGVRESTFFKIKQRVKEGKVRCNTKSVRRLLS